MNTLEFVRGETTYMLKSDGSLLARSGEGEAPGTWTSESDGERNELTLRRPGHEDVAVPVDYSFFFRLGKGDMEPAQNRSPRRRRA